jgi:hypothetical protein
MAEAGAAPELTALDVAGEMITRVKATDPADMESALLAGWEGLWLTLVLDFLLAQRVAAVDRLPFPGFTWQPGACQQKLDIAMSWLEAAPALPNLANTTGETSIMTLALVPPALAEQAMHPALANLTAFDQAEKLELVGAEILRTGIRTIWLRVHELLTAADGYTTDLDDGRACRIAALMAGELASPDTIDTRRNLTRRVLAAKNPQRHTREQLLTDSALIDQLHAAVAGSARKDDGWATLRKVSTALTRANPEWVCEVWGFDSDLGLIKATGLFEIRRVPRDGKRAVEIRERGFE